MGDNTKVVQVKMAADHACLMSNVTVTESRAAFSVRPLCESLDGKYSVCISCTCCRLHYLSGLQISVKNNSLISSLY